MPERGVKWTLWVSDKEMIQRLGVPETSARAAILSTGGFAQVVDVGGSVGDTRHASKKPTVQTIRKRIATSFPSACCPTPGPVIYKPPD
jgi:hypothetical protein